MKNIILTVSYGAHTDCLTITQKTTWSDLRASVFDYSRLSVTQLYYRDREGDIIAFSSDGELDSLKQHCTTGWLHLSTNPTKTIRWVFDDSFVNHRDDLEQQSIPTSQYPTTSNSTPIPSTMSPAKKYSTDNIATTSFTSQFEQFGKLMDKYNDLIQQDEQVKAMMHQTATEITLQHSKVDLAELEIRLKNYQGNSSKALYPQRGKLSSGSLGNTSMGLSRSATTATTSSLSSRRTTMKRTPTASLYREYDSSNDQPWLTPPTSYPDGPPPSYESQQPTTSTQQHDENENRKRDRRRHTTHYGKFDQHSFPSSSWGEWPAYSSLHPPPPPSSQGTNDATSFSSPPPTAPEFHDTPPPSAPSSPPGSVQHHHHHHHQYSQRPPMSLYPRPPILPALLKRTSRLISHWVPPLTVPAPPSPPCHPPLPSIGVASPSISAMNGSPYRSYYANDNDTKTPYSSNDFASSSCKRKQKGKQYEHQNENGHAKDHHDYGVSDSIRDRQMYKEQQRSLRQQQKELARTRRHLKRQEKRDRKEHRRQQRHAHTMNSNNSHPLPLEQNEKQHERQISSSGSRHLPHDKQHGRRVSLYGNGGRDSGSIRKSSSLSSLSSISSLSSQSTCSSIFSSSTSSSSSPPPPHNLKKTHQQQQHSVLDHHSALQYPSIPTSLVQHHHSSPPGNDDQHGRCREGGDDESLDGKLDKRDLEYLANTFNQLSATNDAPPPVPRKQ